MIDISQLLAIGHGVVVAIAILVVPAIVRNRAPAATFAWLLVLAFLPGVGVVLFLMFGRAHVRWPARMKREADAALAVHLHGIVQAENGQTALALLGPTEQAVFAVGSKLTGAHASANNTATLLDNGEACFQSLKSAISNARHHVNAQYYLIRGDDTGREFVTLLEDAVRRGVQVRLLVDGFGSILMPRRWRRELRAKGVHFSVFFPLRWLPIAPMNLRNHRKIVVVDGRVAFTGGNNIGDEYRHKSHFGAAWRDTHLQLEGRVVADLQRVFLRDWFFASREMVVDPAFFPELQSARGTALASIITSGPDIDGEAIERCFFAAIAGAQNRVLMTTPYFVPDSSVVTALEVAALRGVEVRVLLPAKSNHVVTFYAGRSFYERLINAGVHIHEYLPGMIHAKTMLVDDRLGFVGSANLDVRSFRLNYEVHTLVHDATFAAALGASFSRDLAQSKEIALGEWHERRATQKLAEGAAHLVSPML